MLLAKKLSDMTEEERTAHELKKEEEKAKKQALQEEAVHRSFDLYDYELEFRVIALAGEDHDEPE